MCDADTLAVVFASGPDGVARSPSASESRRHCRTTRPSSGRLLVPVVGETSPFIPFRTGQQCLFPSRRTLLFSLLSLLPLSHSLCPTMHAYIHPRANPTYASTQHCYFRRSRLACRRRFGSASIYPVSKVQLRRSSAAFTLVSVFASSPCFVTTPRCPSMDPDRPAWPITCLCPAIVHDAFVVYTQIVYMYVLVHHVRLFALADASR